jgi:hypothetical protein
MKDNVPDKTIYQFINDLKESGDVSKWRK